MGYDLSLLPPRGTLLPRSETKKFVEYFYNETNLNGPCEITELQNEPHVFDSKTLDECFREGEFTRSEYEAFCSAHHLTPQASQAEADEAARLFLDYKCGQDLFVLKLPSEDEEVREAYRLIVEFARRHDLLVHDPQIGHDIDVDNPGAFPPMWGPMLKPEPPKRRWFSWRKREA